MKRIAILTGGADCPGLNAAIKGLVLAAQEHKLKTLGIKFGWRGLYRRPQILELDYDTVENIQSQGGTILGTSRSNPFLYPEELHTITNNLEQLELDGLIVIGGKDTLEVAYKFSQQNIKIVAIPKTINNDVPATDYPLGFDSAVRVATESFDRLQTTARSHQRIIVVEIMGRYAGWLALYSGVAGGAQLILIPEVPFSLDQVCERLIQRRRQDKPFAVISVAEGAVPSSDAHLFIRDEREDEFGQVRLGGIAELLARIIEERVGVETRNVALGHLQRGGVPSNYDRFMGMQFALKAIELISKGEFGRMVCLNATRVESVPLQKATEKLKTVPPELYERLKPLLV